MEDTRITWFASGGAWTTPKTKIFPKKTKKNRWVRRETEEIFFPIVRFSFCVDSRQLAIRTPSNSPDDS
jgi:hypothetical protein